MISKKRLLWIAGVLALVLAMAGIRQSVRLEASLLIDAPPGKVWAALSDFKSYEGWNPYIINAELLGNTGLQAGARLKLMMQPAGRRQTTPDGLPVQSNTYETKIYFVRAEKELRWTSSLWLPFLFDSEHWYQLKAVGSRTMLYNGEEINGLFLFLVNRQATRQGFVAMNEALKIHLERNK